ncbi:cytochrome C biogenesis protein CcmB [Leptolinea sp. HRD-7]|jgi:heme exporter protein B|nr:cytochrome C biogenesis protein CcmB [Leptolinea sp. HRD-7]
MTPLVNFIRVTIDILRKDLMLEWRSREQVGGMLVFALLAILMFNFALELESSWTAGIVAGVLWVTLVFAGTIGLNQSMAAEKVNGCFDGLLLAPVDRSAIFFGKALGNTLSMWVVAGFLMPLLAVLYPVNILHGGIVLIIVLGTLGYSMAGTLLAAMTIQTRARDALLPILLFPLALPVLLAAVRSTGMLLSGFPLTDARFWVDMLTAFDVIFAVLGWMLFDYVVEE